jgi:TetR/AcrR family transcriptional regulator
LSHVPRKLEKELLLGSDGEVHCCQVATRSPRPQDLGARGVQLFKRAFNICFMSGARAKRWHSRVGRPPSQAANDVHAALIAAARHLFLKHGYQKVTARQIATAAGTTPAMIHYYFGNKMGLFRAMLHEAVQPFTRLLSAAKATPSMDISSIIDAHIRTIAANPWIVSLLVHEVLPEGGKFRAAFVREIASRLFPMLVGVVEQGRREGRLRTDLDARLVALSIVSLNVFPLVVRSIAAPVLGFKLEGAELDRLIAHTSSLLLNGITAEPTKTTHSRART